MTHVKFSLSLICFLLIVFVHCGCVENESETPIVMTFGELIDDYKSTYNWEAAYQTDNFTSLKDGDLLILRDQIYNLTYQVDENTTYIEFNSSTGLDNFFPIQGNITDSFSIGDIVEIRLHVIKVIFSTLDTTDRLVTIERETFKEYWDASNNTSIPVPPQYITPYIPPES